MGVFFLLFLLLFTCKLEVEQMCFLSLLKTKKTHSLDQLKSCTESAVVKKTHPICFTTTKLIYCAQIKFPPPTESNEVCNGEIQNGLINTVSHHILITAHCC